MCVHDSRGLHLASMHASAHVSALASLQLYVPLSIEIRTCLMRLQMRARSRSTGCARPSWRPFPCCIHGRSAPATASKISPHAHQPHVPANPPSTLPALLSRVRLPHQTMPACPCVPHACNPLCGLPCVRLRDLRDDLLLLDHRIEGLDRTVLGRRRWWLDFGRQLVQLLGRQLLVVVRHG